MIDAQFYLMGIILQQTKLTEESIVNAVFQFSATYIKWQVGKMIILGLKSNKRHEIEFAYIKKNGQRMLFC